MGVIGHRDSDGDYRTPTWFTQNDTDPNSDPLFVTAVAGLTADGVIGSTGLTANFEVIGGLNQLVDISGLAVTGSYTLSYTLSDGSATDTNNSVSLTVVNTTSGDNILDATTVPSLGFNDFSYIDGESGGDTITGDMTLSGNAGVDTFLGNNGVDTLSGGGGADKLFGNSNDDTLRGDAGNDVLDGGNNNDVLIGGSGNDTLTGGNGDDIFRFNLTTEGIDTIIDFDVSNDTIQFDNASFTTIGADGTLAAGAFVIGAAAADAGDRVIYNNTTGALYYDSDGTGATAAIQIASMATGLSLTNSDFQII